jgi:hypothetical protein
MNSFFAVVVIVLLIVLILAVVIGLSVGIGWILTLILPFTLFEGTLVGMGAAMVTGLLAERLFRASTGYGLDDIEPYYEEGIPMSRFWESEEEMTWENWFRYLFADAIHDDILTSPPWVGAMTPDEVEETAIQLADLAVAALKKKSPRAERMRVSRTMLKREMDRPNRPNLDEDLLDLAVTSVNVELIPVEGILESVIKSRSWDEPAEDY